MNSQSVDCEIPTTQPSSKWQHKAILIFVLCILPFLAVFFSWERLTSRRYQATAFLRFRASREDLVANSPFKSQQKEHFRNRLLLNAALNKPGIANLSLFRNLDDPVGWLSQNLEVTIPGDAEIMKVSLSGADRKEIAMIVNAAVDAYMEEVVEAERKRLEDRIGEMKKLQTEKIQEIKEAEKQIATFEMMREKQDSEEDEKQWLNMKEGSNCTFDLAQARRAFKTRQKCLDEINEELQSMQIEQRIHPRVNILQKAEVPESP